MPAVPDTGRAFSFFLASTLTTGLPGLPVLPDLLADVPELGVPVRVLLPLQDLGLPCRLYPSSRNIRAIASFPHPNPSRVMRRPISRSGSEQYVISAIGSPRVASSSSPFSPSLNRGCVSSAFFRPPPGRRDRPGGRSSTPPDSISAMPAATVVSDTPAVSATVLIPPRPSASASVPRYTRHVRSSATFRITANFAASPATAPPETAITHPGTPNPETTT